MREPEHTTVFLTGVTAALAAFVTLHRFEFLGVGVRAAAGLAAATLAAGAAVGVGVACLTGRARRLTPAVLAAVLWPAFAAAPFGVHVHAEVGLGLLGAAASAWVLANVCRARRLDAWALAGALVGFGAGSAGIVGAVGVFPAVTVAAVAAAAAAFAARSRTMPAPGPEESDPQPPALAPLLRAVAWGAVAAGLVRAYVPAARSCGYAAADLGVAFVLGGLLWTGLRGQGVRMRAAGACAAGLLLVLALLNGYSFFLYPALILSEPAALQTPASLLVPGAYFPFWAMACVLGAMATAARRAAGPHGTAAPLGAAAFGAALAGLLAGHGAAAVLVSVVLAAVAFVVAAAEAARAARAATRVFLVCGGLLAVGAVVWAWRADPQCGLLGIRHVMALETAGGQDGEPEPVSLDAFEYTLDAAGLTARARRGTAVAELFNAYLVGAGAEGSIEASLALAVALPFAYGEPGGATGVVAPVLPSTWRCARALTRPEHLRPVDLRRGGGGRDFDRIVCGPGPISGPGSPLSVLSREALLAVRARLRPGGVFGLWLPVGTLEPDALRDALATVRDVFPTFHVYLAGLDAVVVAGEDLSLSYTQLRSLQPHLTGAGLYEPMDLICGYAGDSGDIARLLDGARVDSMARPRRMPAFAPRAAGRVWPVSLALLAQHRLAGPGRLLERLRFESTVQRALALHGFDGVYGEQTWHLLRALGTLSGDEGAAALARFVAGPLVCRSLFDDGTRGPVVQAAAVFMALGLPKAAAATVARALESSPDDPVLHVELAGILEEMQQAEKAILHYEAALRVEPSSTVALQRMTANMLALGRHRQAAETLERFLEQQPDNVRAMLLLGQLYVGPLGRRERAAELAQRVLELEPGDAAAQELLLLSGAGAASAQAAPAPR